MAPPRQHNYDLDNPKSRSKSDLLSPIREALARLLGRCPAGNRALMAMVGSGKPAPAEAGVRLAVMGDRRPQMAADTLSLRHPKIADRPE